eukprot:6188041-Pleurochrysis_carterae.AAC.1
MSSYDERKRRMDSGIYYPYKEEFQMDTRARMNTLAIIQSLSDACSNGCFPNITKLIIEEPLDDLAISIVFNMGFSPYASRLKELSFVVVERCDARLADDDILRIAGNYAQSFPSLDFLQVIYDTFDGDHVEDLTCGVDRIQSFLMMKALRTIRFPICLPVRHSNLHMIDTHNLTTFHVAIYDDFIPPEVEASFLRFAQNDLSNLKILMMDMPYIPGILSNMTNIEKVVRYRHLYSNEDAKWSQNDLVQCINDIQHVNVRKRNVHIDLSDYSDVTRWTQAADVLLDNDAVGITVHGGQDRGLAFDESGNQYDGDWPHTGEISHDS